MTIDNFDLIRNLLYFESKDDFYFIQIIKRRKENDSLHKGSMPIKCFLVDSLEYFDRIKNEIVDLCEKNNSRAYILLTLRSYKKSAHKLLDKTVKKLAAGEYKSLEGDYHSVCASKDSISNTKRRLWLFDIDEEYPEEFYDTLYTFLKTLNPIGEDKVLSEIPTKNGKHIILKTFDQHSFKKQYPEIEIKTNNATLLYM